MEHLFTAGCWSVAFKSQAVEEAFVIESETRTIAWTANTHPFNSDEGQTTVQDHANAVLISHAPNLVEALEDAREFIMRFSKSIPEEIEQSKKISQALEQALGKGVIQ